MRSNVSSWSARYAARGYAQSSVSDKSALYPPVADIHCGSRNVCFVPKADLCATAKRGRLMPPPSGLKKLGCLRHLLSSPPWSLSSPPWSPPPGRPPPGGADPPNDTGAWNLNQRTIAVAYEFRVRIGLAEVAHRAVVGNPSAAVGPEPDVGRTIERVEEARAHKGLLEVLVKCEARNFELKRLLNFGKVKEFDLMVPTSGAGAVAFALEKPKSPSNA